MRIISLLTISILLGVSGSRGEAAVQQGQGENETVIEQQDRDPFIGKHFLDVQEPDPDGKMRRLSDYAGKGKWVLVDFWASWCGPCREEIPNVVAAYQKYHDKGFEVVGLSFDADKDDWKEAIKSWNMPWIHLSDLKYWQSKAGEVYGVRAIPDNILIDPNGIIVARGLRGSQLKAVLSDIFYSSTEKRLTIALLAAGIRECDIALNNLQATIDADETSPGERFEARQAYASITRERKRWIKELEQYIDSLTE